ncbi:MAG: polymer-forming cytoskeletal protein [Halanaerobiales bacterium]|nr:polymer-forming cytoskeletal protein [Halanaerobiales bacterium]
MSKEDINTIFGQQTIVDGKLTTKGSIRIEGEMKGTIIAEGDVFIGESGEVNSNIEARNIVIAGNVEGNVTAKEKLEILAAGRLEGNIKSKRLVIEEGAKFIGESIPLVENEVQKPKQKDKNENKVEKVIKK